jgi:hypothetical protein
MHLVHASSLLRVREENWDQTHAEERGGGLKQRSWETDSRSAGQ